MKSLRNGMKFIWNGIKSFGNGMKSLLTCTGRRTKGSWVGRREGRDQSLSIIRGKIGEMNWIGYPFKSELKKK